MTLVATLEVTTVGIKGTLAGEAETGVLSKETLLPLRALVSGVARHKVEDANLGNTQEIDSAVIVNLTLRLADAVGADLAGAILIEFTGHGDINADVGKAALGGTTLGVINTARGVAHTNTKFQIADFVVQAIPVTGARLRNVSADALEANQVRVTTIGGKETLRLDTGTINTNVIAFTLNVFETLITGDRLAVENVAGKTLRALLLPLKTLARDSTNGGEAQLSFDWTVVVASTLNHTVWNTGVGVTDEAFSELLNTVIVCCALTTV